MPDATALPMLLYRISPPHGFCKFFSNKTHHVLFAAMRRRTFSCGFPVSEMPNGAAGQHIRETISENTV